ncbi:AAA family ATPase [Emergencia sp. 1XD21-10]|uniref:AAA family ATPase n=1 Tax=Emergencia sp. 1XD21-10 TaxID=2304569 RepID=UPI00192A67A3|nr:AAA family ATPase [Emergencia sp. 1XD21-10]
MITINEARRLIKRAILANVVSEKKDLAITPLISGKHGIGKSQMIKSIAEELGGVCITIEGGTLKEGEITGLPYQYKDEQGNTRFRFLPYYAVERIQNEQERIFFMSEETTRPSLLQGDENRYALEDITIEEKLEMLKSRKIKSVIIFIDEINRTENSVYKELMNILLTRSVNGYSFPWWVFFVGAMNPSTQNSLYATNEMDPAQLDRFLKIKVSDSTKEWLGYGKKVGLSPEILNFIKDNPKCLSSNDKELQDDEKPTPSPRGWDMVDTLLRSEPLLRDFFTEKENDPKVVEKDMKNLVSAKLGATVATMFFASMVSQTRALMPEEIFADDENLSKLSKKIETMSAAKKIQTCDLMLAYLKENIEFMMLNKAQFDINKCQLSAFVGMLDSSARLLFAQKLSNAISNDGNSLIEILFDVFEKELIEMLDLSDETRKLIEES